MEVAAMCRRARFERSLWRSSATLSPKIPAGFPFATLVAVAFDDCRWPLLLVSSLAEHTKNLEAIDRASLLVTEAAGDPLAAGRMTLVGTCARVPDGEVDATRTRFLDVHPGAKAYASFADFAMRRIEVASVRWVAASEGWSG